MIKILTNALCPICQKGLPAEQVELMTTRGVLVHAECYEQQNKGRDMKEKDFENFCPKCNGKEFKTSISEVSNRDCKINVTCLKCGNYMMVVYTKGTIMYEEDGFWQDQESSTPPPLGINVSENVASKEKIGGG